ncbi:hypothetical protein ACVDG5_018085 [Mesorhizobium sp. ORM6]
MQTAIVNLPFDGFYESHYSGEIDREEESFIEYRCENNGETGADYESHWPEALQLDAGEYGTILFDVSSYGIAYRKVSEWYVAAIDHLLGETLGYAVADKRKAYNVNTREMTEESYMRPSIRATFESMDSPREYNFTTDRLYAEIPLGMMQLLFRKSRTEKHATLAAVIAERFTSRDGFLSHYSRHLAEWLEKPLTDWDHNELGTLLIAVMRMSGIDPDDSDTRETLYYSTFGDDGAYQAWESAVDWERFESKRAEMRAEKLAEWCESDLDGAAIWRANHAEDYAALLAADSTISAIFAEHDAALPYRCPETVDMFTGLPG